MKILVALSGGIDSSTVAHILKEQGHELIGVRFTLWSDPLAPPMAQVLPSKCCNTQTAARAQQTAKDLSIPYHIVDLEKDFKENVVDPFLDGYRKGSTPNPCINCNRTIKFGKLLELAEQFHCEKIATGHYARVACERLSDGSDRHVLLEAVDQTKDQSYYLYGLHQKQLSRVLFPLGSMLKSDVYRLAAHFGVPFEKDRYRESQDLCFFPEKEPKAFLKRHLKDVMSPGNIVHRDGKIIGTHEGLPLYTIGQRRGLKIGGLKVPLEVVEKDVKSNRLIVTEQDSKKISSVHLQELRWISWQPALHVPAPLECRVRSLSPRLQGNIIHNGKQGTFHCSSPESPVAPGQSLVLYRGEEIVGGGVME